MCQAGARWEDINSFLAEKGIPLFFPVRPLPDTFLQFVQHIAYSHILSLTQDLAL